ncbi:helix-turn-helix domain-containing protein [candidate division WWE3 bacterium]|nr:helix-turn-helix domain-containing protein [candidate division WWE3 bacterium]
MQYSKAIKLLGRNIRRRRHALNLSQEELALRADIERSYMGRIERGEANPSFKKICAISRALGREVYELVR